ncbi:UDP-N-acetylglucosamine 1-carboxyvinyltransferase [Peptoniphilus asaccharolyticus DSM 20463]|uniref:UDP-N-acetylglucosamine 1-carboxyvinyltransferase n=1 Tax=Peptoniphilus asaccharolyticus DSM 20463 TaxID=573058 RepID=A0A1W1VJX4_PEPAS|nr:UDP-N-acetylglucosamine 1-carboxyvinyltransferase [Peptoniphilus asaccharolyticus]MBL7574432.1 UDP-N-acetylglucosamine 1-carboxyvinyltransferase [Peptoniphilus asaccharolyticus]SMB93675.1 UDP-N-acetylglucosamine 1-carboxyvinyltransferase [Peptoniphilus asaccharolyticus DSM 20463]
MEKIIVKKSEPLRGTVRISGAKNAALPILAASLLGTEDVILEDVPGLKDVDIMCQVLENLGSTVKRVDKNKIIINSKNLSSYVTSYELMGKMRASFLVMGPLLGRMGKTVNSLPGGCNIGARPIDLHLKGFEALGAKIENNVGDITASCEKLVGDTIYLDFPSVGATENIMTAAVLAEGETVIENAAMEPEIVDLANFLRKMGAKVNGAGTSTIRIKGVEELKGCTHQIIPDRIEAGTFMVAAAMTEGDIKIENVIASHIKPIIAKLEEAGAEVIEEDDSLRVIGNSIKRPINIKTLPYPGFPTDMQAQFMAFTTTLNGKSTVKETVFENRFMHADELVKMGADISAKDREARVVGPSKLKGAKVNATDLRAGAALILAGLMADGETEIGEIYHIDRGYEDIEEKFRSLGAQIERVDI